MGHQIAIKPDGNIVVWSTIVDDFIFDGTPECYIEQARDDAAEEAEERIRKVLYQLGKGEKPYRQFTMSYSEMMLSKKFRDEGHTDDCAINKTGATLKTKCTCDRSCPR